MSGVDLSVVLEDEGEVEPVIHDPPPSRAVAEEDADFGPGQSEGIGGSETPPGVNLVDLLRRETRPVDRRQDLALDRQAGAERLHVRRARTRALEMENEGFWPAQGWLPVQRPAIVRALRAREGLQYSPFRAKSSRLNRESALPMKITVDVDCTPLEARQFMGLPDVEPMQKAAMAEIEKRMMTELERFSPETLFKAWLPIAGMNADWLQEFFKRASPK